MQEIYRNKAPKVGGVGSIEYCLKIDGDGKLYIEMLNNSEGGSFQKGEILFQMCIDTANGVEITGDNNNKMFYQAILLQLGINIEKDKQ